MRALFEAAGFGIIPTATVARVWLASVGSIIPLFLLSALPAQADYKDDVDYTALEMELGAGIPDGSGVPVDHVEASVGGVWMANPINLEYAGKTITDVSGNGTAAFSAHAAGVGNNFYGNTISTSPGITAIASYLADHWIGSGFIRVTTGGFLIFQPAWSASRVSNHSWTGSAGTVLKDLDAVSRLDWVIATDEMVQVAAAPLGKLLSSAYNVISVDPTFLTSTGGSANIDGLYTAGRTKPDLVAPATSGSNATPRVASAAALLIDAAHNNPSWSTDPVVISTTNRNGDTIYNAERAEVIKAALMAGADRETSNTTSTDIIDYRVNTADQTVNGLDRRFGAGQLNISNSYHIVAAGEQNSIEDQAGGAGLIGSTGFDYDPAFGGANASNATATWFFAQTTGSAQLTASLVWNVMIDGGTATSFNRAATLYDLDLQLFDVTDPGNWILAGNSASTNENTENLWLLLDSGKDYALRVTPGAGQATFEWDYALAWQVMPVAPADPLVVDPLVLPAAFQNEWYPAKTLTASNGQPPFTWAIVAGALPVGITMTSDGVISGVPATFSLSSFTVQVTDAASDTATLDLLISVQSRGYVCGACHSASIF